MSEWRWHGHAAHFVGAANCRFHLATTVGDHVVSTVGDWIPTGHSKPQQIGLDRLFETMVFRIVGTHACGCPDIYANEVDMRGYMTAKEAEEGHMEMCRKWSIGTSGGTSDAYEAEGDER